MYFVRLAEYEYFKIQNSKIYNDWLMYFTNPNKRTRSYITQKFRRCNLWSHSIMACKLKLRFTLTQKQNRDNFLCMFRSLRRFKYFNVKAASFYRPSNSIRPSSSSFSCLLHNFTVLNSSLEGPLRISMLQRFIADNFLIPD